MPDPDQPQPPDPSWVVRALLVAERIARTLAPTLAAALALWSVSVSKMNQTKIDAVETRQNEVKEDLDTRAKKDQRANEIKLYEAWKNLDWLAQDSGKLIDKVKAEEAKRVYDEFIAHKNGH